MGGSKSKQTPYVEKEWTKIEEGNTLYDVIKNNSDKRVGELYQFKNNSKDLEA